jgi:hypothetical protein
MGDQNITGAPENLRRFALHLHHQRCAYEGNQPKELHGKYVHYVERLDGPQIAL